MTELVEKLCKNGTCGKVHPIKDIVKSPNTKDGYANICKECAKEAKRIRNINNAKTVARRKSFDSTWCGSGAIYN